MTRVAKWSSWRWCGGDGWRRGGVDATVKVVLMLKTDGGWRGGEDDAAGGDVVTMVWWYGGMEMVVDRSWVAGGQPENSLEKRGRRKSRICVCGASLK
ncbi:hypothetical protein Tco_0551699 [Tanacetum coccineum]